MIVGKILGNIKENPTDKRIVDVKFEWFELEKPRIMKIAEDQTELGIATESPLKNGDILAETNECVYVVKLLETKLLVVYVSTMEEMGRACFELGNRHLSPKITADSVKVVYDEPTYLYMEKIGFKVGQVTEEFSDYIVCKAHGHDHSHSDHHRD